MNTITIDGIVYLDTGHRGFKPWEFSVYQPVEHPYSATLRVWDDGHATIETSSLFVTYASLDDAVAGNPASVRLR
jgi:hypothetical protein